MSVLSGDEKLQRATRHLGRSRLSFLGGRKLYLVGKAEAVGRDLGFDRSAGARCR